MRIGVFGGSFNPVHLGHIKIARDLIKRRLVEKVKFVPVADSYEKSGLAKAEDRYNMLNLAIKDDNRMDVSRIEIDSPYQPLTIETMDKLKTLYDTDLLFIIGSDNLELLPDWEGYEELIERHYIIALNRSGIDSKKIIIERFADHVHKFVTLSHAVELPYSATKVRRLIKTGKPYEHYLKRQVADYIKREGLYLK